MTAPRLKQKKFKVGQKLKDACKMTIKLFKEVSNES